MRGAATVLAVSRAARMGSEMLYVRLLDKLRSGKGIQRCQVKGAASGWQISSRKPANARLSDPGQVPAPFGTYCLCLLNRYDQRNGTMELVDRPDKPKPIKYSK